MGERERGGEPAQLEEKGKKLFHLFASPYDQAPTRKGTAHTHRARAELAPPISTVLDCVD